MIFQKLDFDDKQSSNRPAIMQPFLLLGMAAFYIILA